MPSFNVVYYDCLTMDGVIPVGIDGETISIVFTVSKACAVKTQ